MSEQKLTTIRLIVVEIFQQTIDAASMAIKKQLVVQFCWLFEFPNDFGEESES